MKRWTSSCRYPFFRKVFPPKKITAAKIRFWSSTFTATMRGDRDDASTIARKISRTNAARRSCTWISANWDGAIGLLHRTDIMRIIVAAIARAINCLDSFSRIMAMWWGNIGNRRSTGTRYWLAVRPSNSRACRLFIMRRIGKLLRENCRKWSSTLADVLNNKKGKKIQELWQQKK